MKKPFCLDPSQPDLFPDSMHALDDPNGLLAFGGDLSITRLLCAYQKGIFPWYSENEPIMWWSPDPRLILKPSEVHISKSLRKTINKNHFTVTFDQQFETIISNCATARSKGTWITTEMQQAYIELYNAGFAHSVEVWHNNIIVAGLYGIAIDKFFFGESMFSYETDASKVGFVKLCQKLNSEKFNIIDCQVESPHLISLGAQLITRLKFNNLLQLYCRSQNHSNWCT